MPPETLAQHGDDRGHHGAHTGGGKDQEREVIPGKPGEHDEGCLIVGFDWNLSVRQPVCFAAVAQHRE